MRKPVLSKPADLPTKLKVLLHGPSGAGKTRLAATFPRPVIFDIEDGTTSVKGMDVAVVPKSSIIPDSASLAWTNGLKENIAWFATPDAKDYDTIVIDSLTEMQAAFLEVKMRSVPDPRMAYGAWASYLREIMTMLRSVDKHFVVICRSKVGDNIEGGQTMILPELSPASWSNVPALCDYGFYLVQKAGLGNAASTPTIFTGQGGGANAWGKSRGKLPQTIVPATFNAIAAAIKQGAGAPA